MLPALTTRPKQAVRQVQGLTDDSIDAYANTPLGTGGASFADNAESEVGISRASAPTTSRSASMHLNSARSVTTKKPADADDAREGVLARMMRDRKATGDEDLSLRTGDVVRVLSPKRTGYLKCEFADQIGYVPSSYLEFFDETAAASGSGGGGGGNVTARDTADDAETPRSEKRKKKKKDKERDKEKRRKEKDASDGEDAGESPSRSPQKVTPRSPVDDAAERAASESPRKSKKKHRKHRRDDDDAAEDEPLPSRRDKDLDDDGGERAKRSSRRREKKRRDRRSSESSESDGVRARRGKKTRRRRHRHSDSESNSSQEQDSDASYRRRHRRRHRRSSSEEEDYDSDQKRRSPRRSRKNRARGSDGSDAEQNDAGARSARKSARKRRDVDVGDGVASPADKKQSGGDSYVVATEKALARLDVQDKTRSTTAKGGDGSLKSEISDHINETTNEFGSSTTAKAGSGAKEGADKGSNESSSRSKAKDSARKDDESRTESSVAAAANKGGKSTLGKQIGEKMRSFLGGGKKSDRSTKSSSGILNACPGTVQGEEGWYEHGESERYYFILVDGKWSLLYGPMTEDDFESFSAKVSWTLTWTRVPWRRGTDEICCWCCR